MPSTTQQFIFRVIGVKEIVDGDTYRLELDQGFDDSTMKEIRLNGYDAPETHPKAQKYVDLGVPAARIPTRIAVEKDAADRAHQAAIAYFARTDVDIFVQTVSQDDFGRWLGTVWTDAADGNRAYFGDDLVSQQLASVWPTRWYQEFNS